MAKYQDKLLKSFGKKMQELRNMRKITQFALAEKANLSHKYVSEIERGVVNISLRNMYNLANALGMSFQDFLFYTISQEAQKKHANELIENVLGVIRENQDKHLILLNDIFRVIKEFKKR